MRKRRILALLLATLFILGLFSGCKKNETQSDGNESTAVNKENSSNKDSGSEEVITIRFLSRMGKDVNRADAGFLEKVREFDELHPEIKVIDESVPGADDTVYFDKVKSYIAVGDMPDIIQTYGGSAVREYAENGVYLDLDPYFEKDPDWKNSFIDFFGLWRFPSIKGTYGVPIRYFGVQLIYNKDIFEKNNIEVPKTIEDFEKVCKELVDKGITPMELGGVESWRFAHLSTVLAMKKYGPDLIDHLADRSVKYTGPEMESILTQISNWQKAGYFGENISSVDYEMEKSIFKTGESAMHMDGTWVAEEIQKASDENGIRFGVTNFPYYSDVPANEFYSMGGPDGGFSVAKTGDQKREDAAVELLKYILSEESVKYNYEKGGTQLIPVKTDMSPFPDNDFYNELNAAITNDKAVYRQEIDAYDSLSQMQDTYRNALQGLCTGNSPKEALKQIQDEIDNSEK